MRAAESPRTPPAVGGFTLVEVLIALAIVAVYMAVAYSAIYDTADKTILGRERTFAEWVALNRIAEVRLAKQRPSVGRSSGESELAGEIWRWELEVSETPVEDLLRLDVAVSHADRPDDPVIEVNGFLGPVTQRPATLDWYRAAGGGATGAPAGAREEEGDEAAEQAEGELTEDEG